MTELSFPTILVVAANDLVRHALVRSLQQEGYLVLEADHAAEALRIVRVHSRAIHLTLADADIEGRALVASLKLYRRDMRVLFLAPFARASTLESLAPDLAKIRNLLSPPREGRGVGAERHAS